MSGLITTANENEKKFVCIGDLVALRLAKPHEGWISGTCLQGEECFVSRNLDNFNDCLWEVCVQYQYSASREYEEAILRGVTKLNLDESKEEVDEKEVVVQSSSTTKEKRSMSVINMFIRKRSNANSDNRNIIANDETNLETASILTQLHRAALTEQKLNENMMSLKFGKPILFGDSIQLRHMKTKQFLTVSKNELARQERENMKVTLTESGNILSSLVFISRFKSDKDGTPVYADSETFLAVHDKIGEYIHVAKRHPEFYKREEEVNCSLESTAYQIILYNKGKTESNNNNNTEKLIMAGQLVSIVELEVLSCLAVDHDKVILSSYITEISVEESVGTNKLWIIEKDPVIVGGPIQIGVDCITLRDLNSGKFLKLFDEEDDYMLGLTNCREDASKFNLNSSNQNKGTFLNESTLVELSVQDYWIAQKVDEETGALLKECCGTEIKETAVLSFTLNSMLMRTVGVDLYGGIENTGTLRKFERLARGLKTVQNSKEQMKLVNSHLKEFFEALKTITIFLVGSVNKSVKDYNEVDLISTITFNEKFTLRQTMLREQGLLDVLLDILELCENGVFDDVKAINLNRRQSSVANIKKSFASVRGGSRSRKTVLKKISENSKASSSSALNALNRKILSPTAILAASSNHRSINGGSSSDDDSISDDDSNDDIDDDKTAKFKEKYKPEKPIVEKVNSFSNLIQKGTHRLSMANLLKSAAVAVVADNRIRKVTQTSKAQAEQVDQRASVSNDLSRLCLRLLHVMIIRHYKNQIHIADRLSTILRLVKKIDIAILCVTEMFRDNLQVLQEILSQKEIDILMELLGESEMNYTVLKLMQSICSCPKGVDGTQRMVAVALFKNNSQSSPIIEMHAEYSKLTPHNWNFNSFYYPKGIDKDKDILGYKILKKGLPKILVSWGSNSKSIYSEYALYDIGGKVPLEILCGNSIKTEGRSIRGRLSNFVNPNLKQLALNVSPEDLTTRRRKVVDYLITQLYTVGDMCLDRNYISIQIAESIFQYEKLIAILLNPQVSNLIKAPICRILRCVYVDREPQVVTTLPRLIRSSAEERDSFSASANSENANSMHTFCLLQEVISRYLNFKLNGAQFDEFSAEVMDLLSNLISFGFYHSHDQLNDIMIPLIIALDDHRSGVWHKNIANANKEEVERETFWFCPNFSFFSKLISAAKFIFSYIWKLIHYFVQIFTSILYAYKYLVGFRNDSRKLKYVKSNSLDRKKFDNGKRGEEKSSKIAVPWEKRFLHLYNNTLVGMIFILLVVLVNITLSIISLFYTNKEFDAVDVSFSIYFILELSLRLYCQKQVDGSVSSFFKSIFNCIDALLVAIDWTLFFFFDSNIGNTVQATKGIRVIRLLRLFRLMRAGRLIRKIAKESIEVVWVIPVKYNSVSDEESETIVNILRVLSMIYQRIQEKQLGVLIKAFVKWCDDNKDGNQNIESAILYYFNVMNNERDLLDGIPPMFNELLLDIMMYSDSKLLPEALQLLMTHNCNTLLMMTTAKKVQIIYSAKTEARLNEINQLLRTLRTMTEKYEIWGSKANPETDYETMYVIIDTIIGLSTKQNEETSLGIRNETLVDVEVQMLLKNLDVMTCCMLVNETLFYQTEKLTLPILRILRHCNQLICWFTEGSPENQQIVFRHIEWFIDRIDDGIMSSAVIRSTVRGNLQLIKDYPKRYIGELAEKILTNGHNPDYLDILLGLTEITSIKDSSLTVVKNIIAKFLTSREWKANVLLWCSQYDSPGYLARKEAMAPFVDDLAMTKSEMTPLLLYHTNLLNLLVFCNLGPKLQGVLYFNDVIRSLLDDGVIYPVRCALGNILNDMLLNGIVSIESSAYMWDFIEKLSGELEKYLFNKNKFLAGNAKARIQTGSWLETILNILRSFFQVLDLSSLGDSSELTDGTNFKLTERSYVSIQILLKRVYGTLRNILDEYEDNLGKPLITLATSVIENICYHSDDIEYDPNEFKYYDTEDEGLYRNHINMQRASVTFADFQQTFYRTRFHMLTEELAKVFEASDSSPELFAQIPFIKDNVRYDVRLEPLLMKLSHYIRSSLTKVGSMRRLESGNKSNIPSTTWLIKSLRFLLIDSSLNSRSFKNYIKSFLHRRGRDEAQEVRYCKTFNECGVTLLCIDLLANGIPQQLRLESCKLLIAILKVNSSENQTKQTIYRYLYESDTYHLFYEYLDERLDYLIGWTEQENERRQTVELSEGTYMKSRDVDLPEEIIIFELLELICADNYMPMKDFLREQPNKGKQINVLTPVVKFFSCLSRIDDLFSLQLIRNVMKTLIRLVQGPCKGNQEYLIMRTELLPSFNRFARITSRKSVVDEKRRNCLKEVQECMAKLANVLIEEVSTTSVLYERISRSLELNMLNLALLGTSDNQKEEINLLEIDLSNLNDIDRQVTYGSAQATYLKFLKTLGISADFKFSSFVQSKLDVNIQSIQVVRGGKVHSVHFNIPLVASELHKSSIVKNVTDLDVSSQEEKLKTFLSLIRLLYMEAIHQTKLNRVGLSFLIFLKSNLTGFMFVMAVIMNGLILIYYGTTTSDGVHHTEYRRMLAASSYDDKRYGTDSNDQLYIDEKIVYVINGLNLFQILLSIINVAIILITAVPIYFQYHLEQGKNIVIASFQAAIETAFLWYCTYLVLTILAYLYDIFILSGLLLDFVSIDSTIRDVLLAVQYPARQLFATLIIILIIVNIFAGVVFSVYRHDVIGFNLYDMWEAFKLTISYGIRGEYGISYEMNNTLGNRLILDVLFYFIVLAILRHIFFAIIVDTFGKLRELKYEREDHRNNSCFICGVDRHEFDNMKNIGPLQGFSYHRSVVHNVMNYIYFVILIFEQKSEDDSGIEKHVRDCVAKRDISWLPIGTAGSGPEIAKTLLNTQENIKQNVENFQSKKVSKESDEASNNADANGSQPPDDDKNDDIRKKLASIQLNLSKLLDKDVTKSDSNAAMLSNEQAQNVTATLNSLNISRERASPDAGDLSEKRGRKTFLIKTDDTFSENNNSINNYNSSMQLDNADISYILQSVNNISETLSTLTTRIDNMDTKMANITSNLSTTKNLVRRQDIQSNREEDSYESRSEKKEIIRSSHRQSIARPWSESPSRKINKSDSSNDIESLKAKMNSITGPRKDLLRDLLDT